MNDSLIPESLDARKIFARDAVVQGRWPVSRMQRLSGLLADDSGEVEVDLRFQVDEQHRRLITGRVRTQVNVTCQRCLASMPLTLDEALQMAVVASEAIGLRLPEEIDPWIAGDEPLPLPQLLEEQLILALPLVSRHDEGLCRPAVESVGPETGANGVGESGQGKPGKENPFAVLASLKSGDRK